MASSGVGEMQAERKLVTALYADLVDHTAIQTRVDPEEWWKFLRAYGAEAARPIEQYGGTIEKFIGDAIFAIFGVPQAHEDDAERAVRAAVEVLAVIDRLNARYAARFGAPLRIRLGVATGEAIAPRVTESDRLVTGEITSLAERLQSQAPPNAIVLSDRTYALVASLVEAEPITGLTLKGFPGTHRAFVFRRLRVGVTSLRGTGIGAGLVDREREVTLLDQVAERVRRGQGQIVMLFGEAGLGKSRLVSELLSRLPPEMLILQARCHEFMRATAYGTVVQHLRAYFGVLDSDPPDTGRARVHATLLRLAEMTAPVQEALDYLLGLDPSGAFEDRTRGLEPGEVRNQVVRAISALWSQAASQRALGLVVEDLHWMDSASQAAMEAVMQITDHASLLLVAAGRPERLTAAWEFKVAAERDYPHRFQGIQLDPLAPPDTEELAGRLLAQVGLSPEMKGSVARRSEGNPFYVEEIVRSLQEHVRAGDTGLTRLPDTLQGVLQARLDALPETTRQVLQAAAVIGRVFPLRLLQALAELPADLGAHLSTLQRTGFLVEQQRLPEPEFAFKHALLQEAAYATLLREARQAAHRRLAKALAQEMAAGANLPVIFEHFVLGAAWAEAVEFGERSAAWAREVGAPEQAAAHYQQTVAMFEAHPEVASAETQRRILEAYGDLLVLTGRFDDARTRYRDVLERYVLPLDRARVHRKLTRTLKINGAVEELQRARELLALQPDPAEEAAVLTLMGRFAHHRGDYLEAMNSYVRAREMLREIKDWPNLAWCLYYLGTTQYYVGQYGAVRDIAEELRSLAADLHDPHFSALAHWRLGDAHLMLGQLQAALTEGDACLQAAQATGNVEITAYALRMKGRVLVQLGQLFEAEAVLRNGLSLAEGIEVPTPRIAVSEVLAVVLADLGRCEEAIQVLEAARALAETSKLKESLAGIAVAALRVHTLCGHPRDDAEHCETVLHQWSAYRALLVRGLAAIGEAWAVLGSAERAEGAAQRCHDIAFNDGVRYEAFIARKVLGRAEMLRRRWSEAIRHLSAAMQGFSQMDARLEFGRTLMHLAVATAGGGWVDEGRAMLDRARDALIACGAAADVRRVQEIEPRLGAAEVQ